MNYEIHYEKLICKRKMKSPKGYTENHHIIPKCLGGMKTPENMVRLTAREHFVAHQLLVKINPENFRLTRAVFSMSNNRRYSSRKYSWLREKYSIAMSKRDISEETIEKMKVASKNRCSDTLWFNDGENSFRLDPSKALSSLKPGRLPHERNYQFATCPHCGVVGNTTGGLKRWHFDKCKKKVV